MATPESDNNKKEGRIARHSRLAREAWDRPSSVLEWIQSWAVRLWITKGGGFYGLGYVITFVSLEVRSLTGDVSGSGGVEDFITSQFIQFIVRFSFESFLNALFALAWPFYVLRDNPLMGVAVLIAAFAAYRLLARPLLEGWFPELKKAREAKAERKRGKGAQAGAEAAETETE